MTPMSHPIPYPSFVTGAPTAYMIPSMLPSIPSVMAALPTHVAAYTTGYAPFYSLSMQSLQPSDAGVGRSLLKFPTLLNLICIKRPIFQGNIVKGSIILSIFTEFSH
jgi:hypothetical protein